MVGMCCGIIAQPASVVPRKTYNILIGQLFNGEPIGNTESLDSSLRRKIQKLQEYVQKNPAKIPKVSRRLMRHIKRNLVKPGDNLGDVRVAVHAYIYLLALSVDDDSSYNANFFATELVSGPDAVIPALLEDGRLEVRTMGAELLCTATRVQGEGDNKLDALQDNIPLVCKAARAALRADRAVQKVEETVERRKAGDKLAVPNPLDLMARKDPALLAGLESACLRALVAVVGLCSRQRVLPEYLDQVEAVMLDNLPKDSCFSGLGSTRARQASSSFGSEQASTPAVRDQSPANSSGIIDGSFYTSMGINKVLPQLDSSVHELAVSLLRLIGGFTQDVASVHNVLSVFFAYMDDRQRWQHHSIVKAFYNMLQNSGSLHQFSIFTSMLRHASSKKLTPLDCCRVVELATEQGMSLDPGYSLSALAVALQELPKVWAEQAKRSPKQLTLQAFLDFFRMATRHEQGLDTSPSPRANTPAVGASTFAVAGSDISTAGSSHLPYPQQLAMLKDAIMACVSVLASRITSAAELSEALCVALRIAGANAASGSGSVDGSSANSGAWGSGQGASNAQKGGPAPATAAAVTATAGTVAAAMAAAGGGGITGSSPGAAAGNPGGAAGGTAPIEVAETVAAMILECAVVAARAAAYMSPEASELQRALPGYALPGAFVDLALPLLRRWPVVLRWSIYSILNAFLPGAPKGLKGERQARQLVAALFAELPRTCREELAREDVTPEYYACLDRLMRACIERGPPRASVLLVLAQLLLQWQSHRLSQGGCAGFCPTKPWRAHACLLLVNSWLQLLAGAANCPAITALQLPLSTSPAGLGITNLGVQAAASSRKAPAAADSVFENGTMWTDVGPAGPAGTVASQAVSSSSHQASAAELSRLDGVIGAAAGSSTESQQPGVSSSGSSSSWLEAFSRAPVLEEAYGSNLPKLLQELLPAQKARISDGGAAKQQFADKVNTLLVRRMSTLRRDLVHVSELMRNSLVQINEGAPSATTFLHNRSSISEEGASALAAAVAASASHAEQQVPGSSSEGAKQAASRAGGPSPIPTAAVLTPSAAAIAKGLGDENLDASAGDTSSRPVSPDQVKLSLLPPNIEELLQQTLADPGGKGYFVVGDLQISQLASQLEPVPTPHE